MNEAIITLPSGSFFDLSDIFELRTTPINSQRSMVTLQVVVIPPTATAHSVEAWELDDYLQDVYEILFSEIRAIEKDHDLQATWIFERFANQCLQIVPNSQVPEHINQLVSVLAKIPKSCPDLFGLVWESKACWEENREKGTTRTDSWVQELEIEK